MELEISDNVSDSNALRSEIEYTEMRLHKNEDQPHAVADSLTRVQNQEDVEERHTKLVILISSVQYRTSFFRENTQPYHCETRVANCLRRVADQFLKYRLDQIDVDDCVRKVLDCV